MNPFIVVMTLLSCGCLSWCITRWYLLFAQHRDIVDVPNHRSSHSTPTPRGGGISFVAVFLLIAIVLGVAHLLSVRETVGLLGGTLIAGAGYWDDYAGLSIRVRFLLQMIGAGCAVFCFGTDFLLSVSTSHVIGQLVSAAVLVVFVWLINLTNFMDGIDGIAGTEAFIVSGICCLLSSYRHGFDSASLLFGVLAVSVLGFLCMNWPPAKIFMGDVGSGFLGYCFGALTLLVASRQRLSVWTPVILLGAFVVDATFTLVKRMARGEIWYSPHRTHAFQHLAARFGHRTTTLTVGIVTVVWLAPWAIIADLHPSFGVECLVASWLPLAFAVHLLRAGEPLPANATDGALSQFVLRLGAHAKSLHQKCRANIASLSFYTGRATQMHAVPCQLLLLAILNFGCIYFAFVTRFDGSVPKVRSISLPVLALVWTLVETGVLLAFRAHRSHWHYTSAEELPKLAAVSFMASFIGGLTIAMIYQQPLPRSVYVLNAIYAVAAFAGARLLSRSVYERLRSMARTSEEKRV
ncbi:MAG TPA: glycosyltransferase family 4 protein, partial [Bryobacteraceae bacterium]|nr:glycosyltransferase family 4 protein [Bryobacteraceae bacterium]